VTTVISGIDTLLAVLRVVFLASAGVVAVVCAIDWAVRTRRINAFGPVARFFRSSVDPLIAPVERRVVRAGGVPSSAPWWALGAVVLGGIIVLSVLGFLRDQIVAVAMAASGGPGGIVRFLVEATFAVLQIALLVRVITSWVRVSPYSRWVRWSYVLTEPILRPLRRVIPSLGMLDITPIVAYFLLQLLSSLILGVL
jgi:YggT family protein